MTGVAEEPDETSGSRDVAETARSVIRLLRERQWQYALLAVVVFAVACGFLGRWQFGRYEGKAARGSLVSAHYDRAPAPIASVLSPGGAPLAAREAWTPVTATGTYLPADTVLIRNRPLQESAGYEIVVPLRLREGGVLLVDRGWLPSGRTADRPDAVPPPPQGTVTVVAHLLPWEPPRSRTAPPGQAFRIDAALARSVPGPALGGYGVLVRESPAPEQVPRPLGRPEIDLGPHLAYTVQWWLFGVAGFGVLGFQGVREVRRREAGYRPGAPGAAAASPSQAHPSASAARPS